MNNLTTRKIVLGLLMTLVLAFGVQGIADAGVTLSKSSSTSTSGDFQTEIKSRRLSKPFVFTVGRVNKAVEDDTGTENVDESAAADTIQIDPTNGTITKIRIGSTNVFKGSSTDSITLTAKDDIEDAGLKNGTVYVDFMLSGTAGLQGISVTDDGAADVNDDPQDDPIDFTAYAVQGRDDVEPSGGVSTIVFSRPTADILYDTADEEVTIRLTGSASDFAQVNLRITGGSFYRPEGYRVAGDPFSFTTSTTSNLTTHTRNIGSVSTITARFRPSSGSNVQITAQVVYKSELEAVKTYYYRDAVLDKVSGDDQTGRPNTQLRQPLVVRVENQRGAGVSGQVVLFDFEDTATDFSFSTPNSPDDKRAGKFRAVPGTTIYDPAFAATNGLVEAEDHLSFRTEQDELRVVSDGGRAEVYVVLDYEIGTDERKQYYQPMATILRGLEATTAFPHRAATQRFKATADPGRSRDTRDIRIVSGGRRM